MLAVEALSPRANEEFVALPQLLLHFFLPLKFSLLDGQGKVLRPQCLRHLGVKASLFFVVLLFDFLHVHQLPLEFFVIRIPTTLIRQVHFLLVDEALVVSAGVDLLGRIQAVQHLLSQANFFKVHAVEELEVGFALSLHNFVIGLKHGAVDTGAGLGRQRRTI